MKSRHAGRPDRRRSFWKSRLVGWAEARGPRGTSNRPHHAKRPSSRLRRLAVEPLEDRRLLSVMGQEQVIELFSTSPALFIENQGQWADESVRFLHQGDGVNVAMTDTGPMFQLFQSKSTRLAPRDEAPSRGARWLQLPPEGAMGGLPALADQMQPEQAVTQTAQFSVTFDGANLVEPIGLDRADTLFNYFLGGPENWQSEVPSYELVAYEGLYEGIDLQTWGKRSHLKYEFRVAPGADYRQIQIRYEGIDGLSLDNDGSLRVGLGEGWDGLIDDAPYIYQLIDGDEVEVPGRFVLLDDSTYAFELTGDYDPGRELVIDPELAWGTYLGGVDGDWGYGIAVDGAGNAYVTGVTISSGWATAGAYDTSYNGMFGGTYGDVFVAKLDPTGSNLLYATYLGGDYLDEGRGIAVDAAGNAYVTGATYSSGWGRGWKWYSGGGDAFVAKLDPTGSSLLYATYLGGDNLDEGQDIALDVAGNAYVTGRTRSSGWATPGAYDTSNNGRQDVFVAKLDPTGSSLLYATYLGGGDLDEGQGIAADAAGNAYVTGYTESFGWATAGAYDSSYNGGGDVFVAKLNPTGTGLLYCTYLGGGAGDGRYWIGIAVDATGNAYVTGKTGSSGWATAGAYDSSYNGGYDVFVAKLNPSGSSLLYSTYLGGRDSDQGYGIAADAAGNAYVTGRTRSSDWATPGAYDTSYNGGGDVFVAKLNPTGSSLLYCTYLGGGSTEKGNGIAVDYAGNVYVTGWIWSSDWGTPGAYDASYNGDFDVFVAKIVGISATVVRRHVFYNNSNWDDPLRDRDDDDAIAPDKVALRPGGAARFDNYTSYVRGINGIMVDIAGLPAAEGTVDAADYFEFKVGNDDNPGGWDDAPDPLSLTVRPGKGVDESDRVTIIFPDGEIQTQWLRVTVLANEHTDLQKNDVFYFGNAIGETGNSAGNAIVNVEDILITRADPHPFWDPAGIGTVGDFDRDERVDVTDVLIARANQTWSFTALKLWGLALPLMITEAATGNPDYVEIQNVSAEGADSSGWVVAVNDPPNVNDVVTTLWHLPDSMLVDEVLYRSDDSDDVGHYWGADIPWLSRGSGWVMILNDRGYIADFLVWGYSTDQIASIDVEINGFEHITIGDAWSGPKVEGTGSRSNSLQRIGDSDHSDASDWIFTSPQSPGEQNEGLNTPFPTDGAPAKGSLSLDKASAHDAVLEQAGGQRSNGRATSLAKMGWLYDFEPTSAQHRPSKENDSLEKAVEGLLWLRFGREP